MADLAQASLAGTAIGSTPGSTLPAAGIEACFEVAYAGFRLDVDLRLPGRGVTALFGHSGSGKTTLLRCVAGLEPAARGRLVVNGECQRNAMRNPCVLSVLQFIVEWRKARRSRRLKARSAPPWLRVVRSIRPQRAPVRSSTVAGPW